jgi:hypothetical protein
MSLEQAVAREHIRDTMARYSMAVDSADLANFLPVFTDDIVFESPIFVLKGIEEVRKFYTTRFAPASRTGLKFRRHNLTTCQIDLTSATTANAKTYYYVMTEVGPDHCGYYVDRFREVNGRWLIAYREVWTDWSAPNGVCAPDLVKQQIREKGSSGPAAAMAAAGL